MARDNTGWIVLGLLVAGAAGAGAYYWRRRRSGGAGSSTEEDVKTTPAADGGTWPPAVGQWDQVLLLNQGQTPILRSGNVLAWQGHLVLDDDGDPMCYNPADWGTLNGREPLGRDAPENAVGSWKPGGGRAITDVAKWAGVVTGPDGQPLVQGEGDPAPGFWISQTALGDHNYPASDPRRFVNAWEIPYLSIPAQLRDQGAQLGDVAAVEYGNQVCFAILADIGPSGKIGEGSPALARALGLPDNPRSGSTRDGLTTYVFAGSGNKKPLSVDEIYARAQPLYERLFSSGPSASVA